MAKANSLYYGDNLGVMREYFGDASIDLVYLDPPFNSKQDYNLLFKSPRGKQSEAQITAFKDTWHWGEQAEREFDEVLRQPNTNAAEMMKALRSFLGENDMMAYLTMMANRLLELHRVLKPTGSLYLHCDPTASHYLKIVLDSVFGKTMFRSEIIWKRTAAHGGAMRWGPIHDTLFYYAKTGTANWNPPYAAYSQKYTDDFFRFEDAEGRRYRHTILTGSGTRKGRSGQAWRGVNPTDSGRHWAVPGYVRHLLKDPKVANVQDALDQLDSIGRVAWPKKIGGTPQFKQYLDDLPGAQAQDVWSDIPPISAQARERLGYPTQKPIALLERIVQASSDPGDVILDPFCGCGTAVHAAEKLKRKWIGIDITHLAISLIEKRLGDAFPDTVKFDVHGTPKDLDGARDLAARDKYQFQYWAVSLVEAYPSQNKKKGADGGIDGLKYFYDLADTEARKIVISVKSGHLKMDDVRALANVRDKEKADIALLISLEDPTPKMKSEAVAAGFFKWETGRKSPRVQLLTVQGLLEGTQRADHPDYRPNVNFKKAKREKRSGGPELFDDSPDNPPA